MGGWGNTWRMEPSVKSERRLRATVLGVGLVRIAAGVALGGAPRSFLRWERGIPPGSSMNLLLRTVGIRDLALGLGTVRAAWSGSTPDVRRWLEAGLASDSLDIAAGLAAARTTGIRGVSSALVALPVAIADVCAVAMLRTGEARQ